MTINPDFETCSSGPTDGFIKVGVCSFEVLGVGVVIGPEANWDSERVDASRGDGFDVCLGKEG